MDIIELLGDVKRLEETVSLAREAQGLVGKPSERFRLLGALAIIETRLEMMRRRMIGRAIAELRRERGRDEVRRQGLDGTADERR